MAYAYMPVSLKLRGRPCLVVGGGGVALRKVETLLDYECRITVIAPEVDRKLEYFAERKKITLERRPYRSPEAGDFGLVIAATDDSGLNRAVYADGAHAGVLVNVADDPEYCDFIFPSVVRRNCLTAAVSTDGKAPFIASHLRVVLSAVFPDHWNELMKHAVTFRRMVRERWRSDAQKRVDCYDRFLESDWKTLLKESSEADIGGELHRMLEP